MDSDSLKIFKKYSNKKPIQDNAFINLSGNYDYREINKDLNDLNSELRKQKITKEKYSEGNEDILDKCKRFIQENSKRIEEQVAQIKCLKMNYLN